MSQPAIAVSDAEIAKLFQDLSSSDPAVRDGASLGTLCEMVDSGNLSTSQLGALGRQSVERLSHARVEARSFAALVLARIVLSGDFDPEWFPHFAAWYSTQDEVTGYDPARGWLHAVAHGADALGAFGWSWPESPRPALDLAVQRMLHPAPTAWHDQEDDRLGFAIAITLSNPSLTQHDALAWMEPLKRAFVLGEPGPVPAFVSNSIHTLRVVCLLARAKMPYEGKILEIRHSNAVESSLRELLHMVSPWMWSLQP